MQRRTASVLIVLVTGLVLTLPVYAYIYSQGSQTVTQLILKTKYYPSNYNLLGSTTYISGALSALQVDDSSYMTFRSYPSAASTTVKTDAFCPYRSNTGTGGTSTPKSRTWTGDTASWSAESELATAGSPIRFARQATCPLLSRCYDRIFVTDSNDGYLDAYVYDGATATWTVTNNIGDTGGSSNAFRCFDIAYETTTGRALLVYSRGTSTLEIGYRIWTYGSGWSAENTLELPYTTGRVNWVMLARCPATRAGTADDNEIAFIMEDVNEDIQGYIWTGSTWSLMGVGAVWDGTAATSTRDVIAVAYEQTTGEAMWIWGDSVATHQNYRTWDGTTLSAVTDLTIANQGGIVAYCSLQANPTNDDLIYSAVDAAYDLNTAYWDGSAWTVSAIEHDADVDFISERCFDCAWQSDGAAALLVWGTTAGSISWQKFTPPDTWTAEATAVYVSTKHWVQLRTNSRNVAGNIMIMGAIESTASDIGCITWDGTTFTVVGTSTFTASVGSLAYECFDLRWQRQMPSEMTFSVEFLGSSDLGSWTSLIWTINSHFSVAGVTATAQLHNWNSGSYPTGAGDGYMTTAIGISDVTMTQTINTNPTYFKDASGNWKMKFTGVLATKAYFNWFADVVWLKPAH